MKVAADAIEEEVPGPAELAPAMPERTERSVVVGDACVLIATQPCVESRLSMLHSCCPLQSVAKRMSSTWSQVSGCPLIAS